jgi:hypothetical protein
MKQSLAGIYSSSVRGIKDYPLVYLVLLVWGIAQALVLIALIFVGSMIWLAAAVTVSGPNAGSSLFYITAGFLGSALFVLAVFSAATRAGILSFGSAIRKSDRPTALHFLRGIFRFTLPLFIGGIVVGMLTAIPALGFLLILRWSFTGAVAEIFTSGWNFEQAIAFLRVIWNTMLVAGTIQLLIFFWIAPWDEMVVLYQIPYPEALVRSFSFVFSREYFLRVIGVIVINVAITQIILILTNIGVFSQGLAYGAAFAYLRVLIHASQSTITSFLQFVFLPFFAYTQLFLLPYPEQQTVKSEERKFVADRAMELPPAI